MKKRSEAAAEAAAKGQARAEPSDGPPDGHARLQAAKAVSDISGELAGVMKEAEKDIAARQAYERKLAADAAIKELFPAGLRAPDLPADFARVQERIFESRDVDGEYVQLERELTLSLQRTDHGSLVKALDDAETNARRAHGLYALACVVKRRWELDADVIEGGMRSAAEEALQAEKDAKQRNKAITENDVRLKSAAMFPDEWRAVQLEREKNKRMVDSLEHLAMTWKARAQDLNTLLHVERR